MRANQVSKDEFIQLSEALSDGYFLFDSQQLEDSEYDARRLAYPDLMPVKVTARDLIDQVDKYTTDIMLWEGTFLEDHKNLGPLLIHFFNETKLLDKHISCWGDRDIGVVIEADSETELAHHLKSLLMVGMPGDGQVRFRFHETSKLSLVINALGDDERISQFLGPIKTMYWQENCGPGICYRKVDNPKPQKTQNECGWFDFTSEEKQKISDTIVAWAKRSILNEIHERIKNDSKANNRLSVYTSKELEVIVDKGYQSALQRNISSQDGIRFYLLTYFFNPEFMKNQQTLDIVSNQEWHESEKIHTLKEMFQVYIEKNYASIC